MSAPRGWDCRRCDLQFEVLVLGGARPRTMQPCPRCSRPVRRIGSVRPARARPAPAESTENALAALSWERRRAAENVN